jgi:hypothetical protein
MTHVFQLFIDGGWIDADGRETRPVINPVDGSFIGNDPCTTPDDLDSAALAAGRAFLDCIARPPVERQALLRRAGQIIAKLAEDIARMMMRDHGNPLREARGAVVGIAELFEWFGEEARRVYCRTIPPQDQVSTQTALRIPVGTVVVFSPLNFPMARSRRIWPRRWRRLPLPDGILCKNPARTYCCGDRMQCNHPDQIGVEPASPIVSTRFDFGTDGALVPRPSLTLWSDAASVSTATPEAFILF